MTGQPPYPYRDGDHAVLGPDVTATADGETITWQGAVYRRDRGDTNPAELTAEEARDLADELGTDLYHAQDALAFVAECCDIADRQQQPITTADVREWLKGARCGRQLAADRVDPTAPPLHFVTLTLNTRPDEATSPYFTARPATPEMEHAATERARQAAEESARSASWFAETGGVLGDPPATEATDTSCPQTTSDSPPASSNATDNSPKGN